MLSEETLNALHLVSWNIAHRLEPWRLLAGAGFDVALLQEAGSPPRDVETDIETNPGPWETQGQGSRRPWRTAVARLSDRVRLSVRPTAPLDLASGDDRPVSRMGTLAFADVEVLETGERLTVASAYGLWESPIPSCEQSLDLCGRLGTSSPVRPFGTHWGGEAPSTPCGR